jgi:hypothetical protein
LAVSFPPNHKPGSRLGVKNKLSRSFIEALAADFEEHGVKAIRQCRVTKPERYLALIANLTPREFFFQHSTVAELQDDELDRMITALRTRIVEEQQRLTAETPLMLTKVPDAIEG